MLGSLNSYGTGLFIEQFLSVWQKEGFPTYLNPSNGDENTLGATVCLTCCMYCILLHHHFLLYFLNVWNVWNIDIS